jgi:hypothetical protein
MTAQDFVPPVEIDNRRGPRRDESFSPLAYAIALALSLLAGFIAGWVT